VVLSGDSRSAHCLTLCCRVPPGYVYQSPYLTAAPSGIVPLPPAPVSHAAALAAAAAATSQFYEYQNAAVAAAASYPGQYPNGFETYPYTGAAGGFLSVPSLLRVAAHNVPPKQFYPHALYSFKS
jgi:hypothetical protein